MVIIAVMGVFGVSGKSWADECFEQPWLVGNGTRVIFGERLTKIIHSNGRVNFPLIIDVDKFQDNTTYKAEIDSDNASAPLRFSVVKG